MTPTGLISRKYIQDILTTEDHNDTRMSHQQEIHKDIITTEDHDDNHMSHQQEIHTGHNNYRRSRLHPHVSLTGCDDNWNLLNYCEMYLTMDIIYSLYFMVTIFCLVSAYRKPHIIFIVADDLGWNDVGWRNQEIKTPNLDRLAKNGVILNSSYVSPTCTPSRNSILTGVYPFRVGLQHSSLLPQDTRHLSLDTPTLPERLKNLGYSTHMIGKWHLGFCDWKHTPVHILFLVLQMALRGLWHLGFCDWKHTPVHRGFDSFLGFLNGGQDYYKHKKENTYDFWLNKTVYYPPKGEYSTKTFTKRAVNLFRQHKGNKKPMYLYLSYQAVHTPLQVPKKYERIYRHVTNKDRRTYNGMVTAMDQSVGTILTALKKYKMLGNSIIVFTTDNGGAANIAGSNLPLRGSKTTLWEGGTRGVGFVYSKRLFKKKYVHEGLFHAVDWVPTLLAAAGGKQDKKLDGINQWPMLRGGKPSRRQGFVYSISETSAAIRIGDYKLIVGSPGIYNQWFTVPKTKSFCNSGDVVEDIFLYDNLNNAVRNIKSYFSWVGSRLPGYYYWRHYKRLQALQKCKKKVKEERQRWVFPKFLLFNIKEDPTETKNLAGNKPMVFKKLKSRLERYWKRAKIFPKQSTFSNNTGKVNGVWTPVLSVKMGVYRILSPDENTWNGLSNKSFGDLDSIVMHVAFEHVGDQYRSRFISACGSLGLLLILDVAENKRVGGLIVKISNNPVNESMIYVLGKNGYLFCKKKSNFSTIHQ
ncbi:unnamed protein product [Mytilus coruscus]|uniref:Sulfatase N-terminal domain-containing protein n=1 Tax=Mytilus coruscus TaxID=42192 RepID=A0A6J8D8Q6_MYTCO|nr:unnamed protein product [Mytilus coruscus]